MNPQMFNSFLEGTKSAIEMAPSVSRDFARSCQTPMLVIPDDTPAHPYQTSVDIASLAPNAEVTVTLGESPRS
jgi:hypothetical protein